MKRVILIALVSLLTLNVSAQWGMWTKLSTYHYVPDKIINWDGKIAVASRFNDVGLMKYSYDILLTDDRGESWNGKCRFCSTADTTVVVTNLAVNNNLLYILVQYETNYSRTFRVYTLNHSGYLNHFGTCNGLDEAVNPSALIFHHGFLFLGCDIDYEPKVYKSEDSGSNWTLQSDDSLSNFGVVTDMYSHGDRLFLSMDSGYDGNGLYYSDDNGVSWIPCGPNTHTPVCNIEGNESRLFVSAQDGLFYSTDMGITWQELDATGSFLSYYLVVNGNEVVAGNGFTDMLITSHNNGSSFYYHAVPHFSGITDMRRAYYDAVDDQNYYFISKIEDHLVVRKLPLYKDTVSFQMNGLSQNNSTSIFMKDNNVLVSTAENGVYYSSNHAGSWFTRKNSLNGKNVKAFTEFNSMIYAATDKGLYYSGNSGIGWTKETSLSQAGISAMVVHENSLWIAVGTNVYKQEFPQVWNNEINSGLPGTDINFLCSASDTLYACTNSGVYVLHMPTWHWSKMAGTNYNATSMLKAGNRVFVTSGNYVYISEDYGCTWEPATFDSQVNCVARLDATIFAGTNSGLYRYDRSADQWISYFYTDMQVYDIEFDETQIFVAAHGGIYRTLLTDVLGTGEFNSHTNPDLYPVPFSSFITIKLNRHTADDIHVIFTNSGGQTVYESDFKTAAERLTITDLDALSPGLYIISLTVDDRVFTRKVVKY